MSPLVTRFFHIVSTYRKNCLTLCHLWKLPESKKRRILDVSFDYNWARILRGSGFTNPLGFIQTRSKR